MIDAKQARKLTEAAKVAIAKAEAEAAEQLKAAEDKTLKKWLPIIGNFISSGVQKATSLGRESYVINLREEVDEYDYDVVTRHVVAWVESLGYTIDQKPDLTWVISW